jgi:hypothetical protein
MEVLVFRAPDSFSAPTSPILFEPKLIDEREEEREVRRGGSSGSVYSI